MHLPTGPTNAMACSPRRLKFRRVAAWVVLGVLVGVLAEYVVLPGVVRTVAQGRLKGLGLADVELGIRRVGLWSLSARGLAASGDPRSPRVDRVSVAYSPASVWQGRVHGIRVDGWRVDVTLADGSWRLVGLELPSASTASSRGWSLDELRDLPLDTIELGHGCVTVHQAGGASVDLPLSGLSFVRGPEAGVWHVTGGIELPGAVVTLTGEVRPGNSKAGWRQEVELNITGKDVDLARCLNLVGDRFAGQVLHVGEMHVRAVMSFDQGQTRPAVEATLKLAGIDATIPAWGLAIKGASLDWPVRWTAEMTSDEGGEMQGHVAIPPFTLFGGSWPEITGVIDQRGLAWTALVSLPLKLDSPLAARLTVGLEREPMVVAAEFRLDEAAGGQLGEMMERLTTSELLKGLSFEGVWGAGVSWRWPGMGGPAADVRVENLTVRGVERDMAVEGVTGTIHFDGLSPLSTPGSQRVTFRGGHSGPLAVGEGLVEFRLTPREETFGGVFVERAVCGFGRTGRLAAYAFPIRFERSRFDFELMLESVGIQDLLTLMTTTQVRGDGLLYGRVPVSIDLDRPQVVELGRGYVFAQPGDGWLEVSDRRWLEATLGAADASVAGQVQQQTIDALTDYEYQRLAFYVEPTDGGLVIRMETSGRGRKGANPLEIGSLKINIKGADLWLNEWLRPARGSPQAVDHALDRYMP
ncbi:MAG: YdbH domain-containing protein [Phycisphaeraceae bacterium]|nr:YdbH domain-containing protein [Phycisphaeraceae bacterium]